MKFCNVVLASSMVFIAGCSTTNSIPYKASMGNVVAIQQKMQADSKTVSVAEVVMAPGVEEAPTCRLLGPIRVAPGKTPAQYIKDAFIEELFMAKVYEPSSPAMISARIEKIEFSSVSPARWDIMMSVSSPRSPGYSVATSYVFDSSWDAYSACRNVADAFGPAVQDLLGKVVTHPQFIELAN